MLQLKKSFIAFSYKNFFLLWIGLVVSNIGNWLQTVALSWIIIQQAASPLIIGLFALANAIPMVLLPPFGGVIADRFHKIKILYCTQVLQVAFALTLFLLAVTGKLTLLPIFIIAALSSAVNAVDNPTRQSLIPKLVPREHLLNAIASHSMAWTGTALIGPAIGGAAVGILGTTPMFLLNAISFFAIIIGLMFMDFKQDELPKKSLSASIVYNEIMEGISYARNHKIILSVLALTAVNALIGRSVNSIIPIFAVHIWHTDATGYGLLLASGGLGALIGGIFVATFGKVRKAGITILTAGFLYAITLGCFALSPSAQLGMVFLALNGIFSLTAGMMMASLVQYHVPDHIRGRVMSLYTICWIGMPSLGAMGSTAVADAFGGFSGAPIAVLLGAAGIIIATIFAIPFFKGIKVKE